jgi:hypothetical protein
VNTYSAQFILAEKEVWLSKKSPYVTERESVSYRVHTHIFTAATSEEAYEKALVMASGMSDEHNDGRGDKTAIFCVGLYELEKLELLGRHIQDELSSPYGIEVSVGPLNTIGLEPTSREALAVFASAANKSSQPTPYRGG